MYHIQNIFSYNHKLFLIALSSISTFNLLFIVMQIFARHKLLLRKLINLKFEFHFTGGFKNEMTYKPFKYI